MRVLVSDKLSETGLEILRATPGFTVDVKTGMKPEELIAAIPAYDALIIRSATTVTEAVVEAAANLKLIGRAGVGVDNVDVKASSKRGVVVMNTPGGNTITTAEHTIAMMMALSRQIPLANASVKSGKWEKKFMGSELSGKTLGVIGLGRIGSLVVRRAHGLDMKVIGHDPFINAAAAEKMGVELVTLDELYARSDFITVHAILTPETKGLIGRESLGKMKKGVRIINCARGALVDEEALAEAIRDKKVAGAALDVFCKEPPADSPLVGLDEVVATPHLGASTYEAQENVAVAIAKQVAGYFTTGIIENAVNVPSIAPELIPVMRPYVALGEKIGAFLAQIAEGGLKKIEVTYMGELAALGQGPVTQSVIKGILEVYVGKTVNFVNAPFLAEARGIEVTATTSSVKRNFASLLGLKLVTDGGEVSAEGAVFAGEEPRLVKLDDFFLEARLSGAMIVSTNNDKPGVIGAIGTFLGGKSINIASFELSRTEMGGKAMAIVTVDTPPTPDDIREMEKIPNIRKVRLARV
ncbi:MAG: phosphoglycerate dehydrogenase [Nitrospinae bacterium]|nr:phosphoglycerate dehydrogenase [Nitrospinota bacterium]